MMGDYAWNLIRKCNTTYKRKNYSNEMFYGLFAVSLRVLFELLICNFFSILRVIFQITNPLCALHKLEIIIS